MGRETVVIDVKNAVEDSPAAASAERLSWRQFADASNPETFCHGWLSVQCRLIPGVAAGAVFHGDVVVATWGDAPRSLPHLGQAAARAGSHRRGVVVHYREGDGVEAGHGRYVVAYPIEVAGVSRGAVALDLGARRESEIQDALHHLEWGSGWLELLDRRHGASVSTPARPERFEAALRLVAQACSHARFQEAATAFATAVATELGCDRVSVGFVARGRARVRALSHTWHLARPTNLVLAIGAAMDEAIDQRSTVVVPDDPVGSVHVSRSHTDLLRQHGHGAVCTVPFLDGGRVVGAITLERSIEAPFEPSTVELVEAVAALAGPILESRRRADRWFPDLHGPHVRPRWIAAGCTLAAGAAGLWYVTTTEVPYRVPAHGVMEAGTRRAAVAPFNGYVRQALVRAGDRVKRGQVLATLEDRELRLERAKWESQRGRFARQRSQALATRNPAQVGIADSQMDQTRAQLALIDDQLARTRIMADVDGLVVNGDLSQALGSPVEKGQILFEIAPLSNYRAVLDVDERDIPDIAVGRRGQLRLAAAPAEPIPFVVEKVTPVSKAKDGRNYFRVEATVDPTGSQLASELQPGMEGVAKIEVDRRRLVAIWLRPLLDWARLALWTWTP